VTETLPCQPRRCRWTRPTDRGASGSATHRPLPGLRRRVDRDEGRACRRRRHVEGRHDHNSLPWAPVLSPKTGCPSFGLTFPGRRDGVIGPRARPPDDPVWAASGRRASALVARGEPGIGGDFLGPMLPLAISGRAAGGFRSTSSAWSPTYTDPLDPRARPPRRRIGSPRPRGRRTSLYAPSSPWRTSRSATGRQLQLERGPTTLQVGVGRRVPWCQSWGTSSTPEPRTPRKPVDPVGGLAVGVRRHQVTVREHKFRSSARGRRHRSPARPWSGPRPLGRLLSGAGVTTPVRPCRS